LKRYKSNISSKPQSELLDYNDLKKLKHALFYDLCAQMDLDIYIACCAWVYYEFLVKKGVVNRTNKNLYLCVVFLLSLKFYDIDDKRYSKFNLDMSIISMKFLIEFSEESSRKKIY
jgi:hypothetical protein